MLRNSVLDILQEGRAVINGWLSVPNSFTAEAMAKMGWDSLTIDIQHGLNDFSTSNQIKSNHPPAKKIQIKSNHTHPHKKTNQIPKCTVTQIKSIQIQIQIK